MCVFTCLCARVRACILVCVCERGYVDVCVFTYLSLHHVVGTRHIGRPLLYQINMFVCKCMSMKGEGGDRGSMNLCVCVSMIHVDIHI